jgi:hypothetical protein
MRNSAAFKAALVCFAVGFALAGCGRGGAQKSASASAAAQSAAAPAADRATADPAAYGHAVDCMAATMSRRNVIDALLKKNGEDPMKAFYAGPTWARRMHELAKQNGHTDADAEIDGMKRLGESNKSATDGHPLFDDAFVIACYGDMPKY